MTRDQPRDRCEQQVETLIGQECPGVAGDEPVRPPGHRRWTVRLDIHAVAGHGYLLPGDPAADQVLSQPPAQHGHVCRQPAGQFLQAAKAAPQHRAHPLHAFFHQGPDLIHHRRPPGGGDRGQPAEEEIMGVDHLYALAPGHLANPADKRRQRRQLGRPLPPGFPRHKARRVGPVIAAIVRYPFPILKASRLGRIGRRLKRRAEHHRLEAHPDLRLHQVPRPDRRPRHVRIRVIDHV